MSAVATSRRSTSCPSGVVRSSTMPRLLRLTPTYRPVSSPRRGPMRRPSSPPGGSILITSAPMSPSSVAPSGAATMQAATQRRQCRQSCSLSAKACRRPCTRTLRRGKKPFTCVANSSSVRRRMLNTPSGHTCAHFSLPSQRLRSISTRHLPATSSHWSSALATVMVVLLALLVVQQKRPSVACASATMRRTISPAGSTSRIMPETCPAGRPPSSTAPS